MPSYADSVREELLEIALKRPCCKKALTAGLMITAAREDKQIKLICKHGAVAEFAAGEFRRQFGKAPEMQCVSRYGHVGWSMLLSASSANRLLYFLDGEEPLSFDCEGCRSAFLRGAFLACGTVNDPQKSTHLEFLLDDPHRALRLSELLRVCGYHPRVTHRKNGIGLYFKDAGSVEDLLALMGAGKMSMDMMNLRIEREIRNQENRATNCVAKNIEKSVSASAKQMEAIEKLTLSGMLAQLPESVRLTARLRAENPDASLEELRNLHTPPITKSGLNHRLQKILAEADKI
ncbi:MAG: DNA-binding protein WhiA [Clostridia bacterium]|nr:DNA-binding protein WhiA [Clostridia bacterium]